MATQSAFRPLGGVLIISQLSFAGFLRDGSSLWVKLFKEGKRISEVAKALSIGRANVYRALEDARIKRERVIRKIGTFPY